MIDKEIGTPNSNQSDSDKIDVKDVLRSFGWTCGPDFDRRYYTDPWVFNLVNVIERQAIQIEKLTENEKVLLGAYIEGSMTTRNPDG